MQRRRAVEEPRLYGAGLVRREVPAGGQRAGSAAPAAVGNSSGGGRVRRRTVWSCGARGVPGPPACLCRECGALLAEQPLCGTPMSVRGLSAR